MAASEAEKDYFHLVTAFLQERDVDRRICSLSYNFFQWEVLATDRAEILDILGCYLNDDLDLITVQLGENVNDLSTLESDFEYLLEYIKTYCPNAQIIVIGDCWEYGNRDRIKKAAAENCGVQYVDLSEIKNVEDYMAGLGTAVYGDDEEWHKIGHSGVAKHPGDKGMAFIAEKIIEAIGD